MKDEININQYVYVHKLRVSATKEYSITKKTAKISDNSPFINVDDKNIVMKVKMIKKVKHMYIHVCFYGCT